MLYKVEVVLGMIFRVCCLKGSKNWYFDYDLENKLICLRENMLVLFGEGCWLYWDLDNEKIVCELIIYKVDF